MKVDALKSSARGKWLSIFDALGIQIPTVGRNGPCPLCGGVDRFMVDKDSVDGTWFCRQCSPKRGDGIGLVQACLGVTFKEAINRISEVVGTVEVSMPKKTDTYDQRKALNSLWRSSVKLSGDDHVSKYLRSRGLVLTPKYTRYCPECYESETRSKMPAMVAQFLGPDGKALTVHRTYLNGTGKANIESPKKLMPGIGPLVGGAIRLFPPDDKTIGIAEGIETSIAATQLSGIPCWAVVSSTLMQGFVPPEGVRRVVIFADADDSFVGQEAAYILAKKLYRAGLVVEVELPKVGKDFNDLLLHEKEKSQCRTAT